MKKIALALTFAFASTAYAAPYAPQEFDFSELAGTVESVHETVIERPLRDVFEHALNPDTVDQLTVRLDDGRAIILQPEDMQRFVPGERVRVIHHTGGVQLEHE